MGADGWGEKLSVFEQIKEGLKEGIAHGRGKLTLRTTADALHHELSGAGITVARGALATDALVVRGVGDPARLPAVRTALAALTLADCERQAHEALAARG